MIIHPVVEHENYFSRDVVTKFHASQRFNAALILILL
jgi:hypothetical protein